ESVVTTFCVNGGILTLASQDNLSVTGNGSGSITLTGSVVDINAALDNLKYHGDLNSNGSDTLTITTNDQGNTGSGNALSDTDTIVITITGVNDAPVLQIGSPADTGIAGGNETTPEDTPLILNIADYVFDADGDLLTVVSNVVGNGSIIDNGNGTITYSPVLNFNGSDNIELEVTDGEFSVTVTIPLLVTEVNDAPVAGEDVGEVMLTQTGTYSVLDNDTDIDGSSLEVISASAPYGSVTVNPDNTISYTANHNTLGFVSITYKIRDEHGLESSAVLRINVKEELNNRVDSPGGFVFSLGSRVEEGRASNLANSIQLKDGEYSVNDPSSVSVKTISDESVTQESEHSVASLKQSIDFDVQLQNSGEIPLIQGVDQPETGQAVEVDTIENTNIQFNQQIDNIINSFID
ncbi:MAG: tandem-95 repeat protein, partial [Lentisphaeraceae bacterium]|nr:tandem-95 repeat protein [Lentisphaeraceae bacterium]